MYYSQFGINKTDFNAMMIDVFKGNLYDIPIIKKYREFNPPPNASSIDNPDLIKYVAIAFDKQSPIRMKFADPIERRIAAAQTVGFPKTKTGKLNAESEHIIKSENFSVNMMVITYLFLQNEHETLTLITFEEALRIQSHKLIGSDVTPTEMKALIANIETLKLAINSIKKIILEEPTDTLLKRDLFTFTQSKRLEIQPEDYAKKFNISEPQIGVLKVSPH
jgi:hypothetical protein